MANNKYDLGEAFKIIEDELIDSMMRNLERHKEWETDEGFDWNAWQSEQLKSLEEYRLNNRKKFSKKFQDINKKIPELINWAREQGGADAEADLLANIGKNRKTSQGVGIDFFRLNNRKMDALVNATTNDFERAEYAVLRRADDEYRQIIYNSQVYANSGAGTYAQAVDMATKDFLSRGIQCIEYANGSRHTISDYTDMAIKTANKRAYLAGEGERRAEWGEHLVIVNKRTDACPKCMKFEGRVFIDDVYSGGTPEDGEYPLLSDAMEQGLYHPRCRDSHSTYYEGISTPPSRPTRADFDRAVEIEEQETRLATAERNVERYDRLAKYSLDPQNKQKYRARADEWEQEVEKLETTSPTNAFEVVPLNSEANKMFSLIDVGKVVLERLGIQKHKIKYGELNINTVGSCNSHPVEKDGKVIMESDTITLNSLDDRPFRYRLKTLFHEMFHAKANGFITDELDYNKTLWNKYEDVLAECSAHYIAKLRGYTEIMPSYPEYIAELLPKLKQLDQFKDCKTIADFGEVAFKIRFEESSAMLGSIINECEKMTINADAYRLKYAHDIITNKSEIIDRMVENVPSLSGYENYLDELITDGLNAIIDGIPLDSNQTTAINQAVAYLMNINGVK